ncbi:MAG TPA: hypothetical protein DDY37_04875 [Legionella sp.]|nr:hypothetical protein [Legionella sp.]
MMTDVAVASDIAFKLPFAPHISGLHVGLTVIALLAIAFFMAWKHKSRVCPVGTCQLIEKKHLGNKTIVYIIGFQNQRFLLADNQHALALHALDTENIHASL